MLSISWGTFATMATLLCVAGPGFYHLGRISKQVDRNERDVAVIYGKLDEIFRYVKNGCSSN